MSHDQENDRSPCRLSIVKSQIFPANPAKVYNVDNGRIDNQFT
jgi:hypothetical protein